MPVFIKLDGVDPIGPEAARETSAPSLNEILVTKTTDCASEPLDASHPGGAMFVFADGSVRSVASGPGDELTFKLDLTEADDDFAFDRLAAGDTAPDPSDGLLPMESLRPADTSYASNHVLYQDLVIPAEPTGAGGGSDVMMESITIVHEGFDLLI